MLLLEISQRPQSVWGGGHYRPSYEKKVSKGYAPNTPVNARRFDPDIITDASTRHRGIARKDKGKHR